MPTMHIATFSLSETFDVGEDTGTLYLMNMMVISILKES